LIASAVGVFAVISEGSKSKLENQALTDDDAGGTPCATLNLGFV
jgi:hypothetical protein